jgi:hypothetical protein
MQIVILETGCVIVVCLQNTRSPVTSANEQKAVVSIIIHIITVLSVLHWRG